MRNTLFYIPHELFGLPLLGFGWAFGGIVVAFVAWLQWRLKTGSQGNDSGKGSAGKAQAESWTSALPMWAIAVAVVVYALPMVEARASDGTPLGLPIRGYGVMVLLGLFCGIAITARRGKQLGIDTDTIVSLGFWMMVIGVLGARVFWVVQKWEELAGDTLIAKLTDALRVTEGGLVIYGGVIGGIVGMLVFCYRNRLSIPSTADLIAPGFLIGLSLGRIGCLLNGCCFGGVCVSDLPKIQFPHGSVPYQAQLDDGRLLGVELQPGKYSGPVLSVADGSPAERLGVTKNDFVENIVAQRVATEEPTDPALPPKMAARIELADQPPKSVLPELMPEYSLPVHPSQIYAAINAALLCGLVWMLQPVMRKDGQAFLLAILLYALSRFVLEGVRSDEAGQLGTSLSIAQLVAIGSGITAAVALFALFLRPAQRAWTWPRV